MNTATLNATAQPTLADAAMQATAAVKNIVRRIITPSAKDKVQIRPTEGEHLGMIESIDVLDETMKLPNSEEHEPIALMSVIIEENNQKFRLYYRNPVSFLKRDLPRIRGYYEVGGIKALARDPNLLKKLSATVEVSYNGENKQFTNIRINGPQASSPAKIAKLDLLASKLLDEDSIPVPGNAPKADANGIVNVQ